MDRGQDFILICCGPCIEKQPGRLCLMNHRFKRPYIFLCIQMKSQKKDIQSHLQPLFPKNPLICWKWQLAQTVSFGWFCKTERYSKRTNAPNSSLRPLFHHPTLRPRKVSIVSEPQGKRNVTMIRAVFTLFPCSLYLQFRVDRQVLMHVWGQLKTAWLYIVDEHYDPIQGWEEVTWYSEEQIGKPALRELSWEIVAASRGTKTVTVHGIRKLASGLSNLLNLLQALSHPLLVFSGPQFNISSLLKTSPSGVSGPKFKASETEERSLSSPLLCCVILGKSHHKFLSSISRQPQSGGKDLPT